MSEMKVLGMRSLFTPVFDRYKLRWSVLLVQEPRQAKDPITVGASRVPTKRHRQQFEQGFLLIKREAFDSPMHLVFARRGGHDCVGNRDSIRNLERRQIGVPLVSRSRYKWRTSATLSLVRFRLPETRGFAAT